MKYAGGAGKESKDQEMAVEAADDDEGKGLQIEGLNLMDKIIYVRGARIIHSIWDVTGDERFMYHMPIACKDSSAILYMFDLTNRWTLNNVIGWYRESIKWNKVVCKCAILNSNSNAILISFFLLLRVAALAAVIILVY